MRITWVEVLLAIWISAIFLDRLILDIQVWGGRALRWRDAFLHLAVRPLIVAQEVHTGPDGEGSRP